MYFSLAEINDNKIIIIIGATNSSLTSYSILNLEHYMFINRHSDSDVMVLSSHRAFKIMKI